MAGAASFVTGAALEEAGVAVEVELFNVAGVLEATPAEVVGGSAVATDLPTTGAAVTWGFSLDECGADPAELTAGPSAERELIQPIPRPRSNMTIPIERGF